MQISPKKVKRTVGMAHRVTVDTFMGNTASLRKIPLTHPGNLVFADFQWLNVSLVAAMHRDIAVDAVTDATKPIFDHKQPQPSVTLCVGQR